MASSGGPRTFLVNQTPMDVHGSIASPLECDAGKRTAWASRASAGVPGTSALLLIGANGDADQTARAFEL